MHPIWFWKELPMRSNLGDEPCRHVCVEFLLTLRLPHPTTVPIFPA